MTDLNLAEIRANARDGETFPDWTLAMADEIDRLRYRLDDHADDRVDTRLTRLLVFLGGSAFGVALAGVSVWLVS